MHAISTAAFVSVLALVSTLAQAMPQAIPKTAPTPSPQPSPSPSPAPSSSDKAVPCTNTYTVPQAEPCDTLVAKLGLSQADILSLNSGLSCDGTIPAGKVLCIKQPKSDLAPACKTKATATATTCDDLASKFGLTPKKFVEYNDNVNSDCTNLVPGQAYCVALD
ncbi:hypothetical protein EDB92DRAFT_2108604 [Lactarius akahatsu]|uniref:LysM domain-containing protein n=1 Tax=Lactarius akahatsu TaxID=416441 RepID=A0AAD4L7A9_9AGAM|nr:hypothetical protein EDB92DRAFT_2109062 [Lactarius akahatsu]KAH8977569.1 hypothetical protein EDB92DRAFT_2108604 [Lactarius akahatsu]